MRLGRRGCGVEVCLFFVLGWGFGMSTMVIEELKFGVFGNFCLAFVNGYMFKHVISSWFQ
jgi:hypothetical protein